MSAPGWRRWAGGAGVALALGMAGARDHAGAQPTAGGERIFAQAGKALAVGTAEGARRAARLYRSAAEAFGRAGRPAAETQCWIGEGLAWLDLDDHDAAEERFLQAQARGLASADRGLLGATHTNLGLVDVARGRPVDALVHFQTALGLAEAAADPGAEARVLTNMAALYAETGAAQAALTTLRRATALLRARADPRSLAASHNDLGILFLGLGALTDAAFHLDRARDTHAEHGDTTAAANSAANLAIVRWRQGTPDRARQLGEEAVRMLRAYGDRRGEAGARLLLAQLDLDAHDATAANPHAARALALARTTGDRRLLGRALHTLAKERLARGDPATGLRAAHRALDIQREIDDLHGQVDTELLLAEAAREDGRLATAIRHAEEAARLVEEVLGGLAADSLLRALGSDRRPVFTLLVDLHASRHRREPTAGHAAHALEAAERGRAHTHHRLRRRSAAVATDAAEAAARERSLRDQILDLAAGQGTTGRSGFRTPAQRHAVRDLVRAHDEALAGTGPIRDPSATVDPTIIAGQLDDEELILAFALGPEESHLFALDRSGLALHALPGAATIGEVVRHFHALLAAGDRRASQAALSVLGARLSRLLLEPVRDRLEGRHLVIVADGPLHYLPFAALPFPDGSGRRLGLEQVVVSLPSVSRAQSLLAGGTPEQRGRGLAAIVAGPDDLPHGLDEARAIARLAAPNSRIFVAAGRAALTGGTLAPYRWLHFATHAEIDDEHPSWSRLLVGGPNGANERREASLHLLDVQALELSAELVTLGGCRTGLGQEIVGGGLMSLARAFETAGVPRVVVSLWDVDDAATARFMTHFYRSLLEDGAPAAEALRAARRHLANDPRWRSPSHWAAFTLIGDWR